MNDRDWTRTPFIVSSDHARDLLKAVDPRFQRRLKMDHVQLVARAMTLNEWQYVPGQVEIKVAYLNGRMYLIDGQHRLQAVVLANKSVRFEICSTYVKDENDLQKLLAAVDNQKKPRSVEDQLHYMGVTKAKNVMSAAILIENLNAGNPYARRRASDLTVTEVYDILQKHGEPLRAAYETAINIYRNLSGFSRRSLITAIYLTEQKYGTTAKLFWEKVKDGANLAPDDHALLLRNYIIKNPLPKDETGQVDGVGLLFWTFNKWMDEEPLKQIKMKHRPGEIRGYTWDRTTKTGTFPWLKGMEP